MPYTLHWESPDGVLRRYLGRVTAAERTESLERICADPRFDALRYTLTDYLGVTDYEVDARQTEEIAAMHVAPLLTNPGIAIAAVATQPAVLAAIAHFKALGFIGQQPYRVFATEPEARRWIAAQPRRARSRFMNTSPAEPLSPVQPGLALDGGCTCRAVRYRLTARPLFTHCCHCRWCQRETGSAFALNAMIETERVQLTGTQAPELVPTPSESGRGQQIARCPHCRVAVWSHYAGAGPRVAFVRVGTLDEPDRLPPDIHIFTASKQPWVLLPPGVPAVAEYYDREAHWPAESLARRRALLGAGG